MDGTRRAMAGLGLSATLGADAAVLGVAAVWGASYPVAKEALAIVPVLALIFYRFLIAACVMAVLARAELARASRRDLARAAVLGVILSAIFLAETAGLARTSATNAALVIALCTVLTPFLDHGLSGRLPPRGVVLGAGAAIAGVALLVGGPTAWTRGEALILVAAGLRAVMVVSTKRLLAGRFLSAAALTAVQAIVVAGLTLLLLLASLGPGALAVRGGASFWGGVAFLALFCTIGAFYVQNAAVHRTSPTRVSFLMGTEPLFGFALAHLVLAEPVTERACLGAALIVGGTLIGLATERAAAPRATLSGPS